MPNVQPAAGMGGGRSRRGRGRRVATSLSEINVVPLVDVMLVLLIIFMVTAPMMQRGLDVNLPVASRSQQINDDRIFVIIPLTYRKDRLVRLGDEAVRVDILHERVRQAMLNRTDRGVFVRGDAGITLQELMDVFDQLKDGGVQNVGIVAKLPGER